MENISTKTCSRCKCALPFDSFYKDKSKKDGFRSLCKDCTKKKKSTKTTVNQPASPDTHKSCNSCQSLKPLSAFYKSGESVRYICMECDNEKRTTRYSSNHGKTKKTNDIKKLALCLQAVVGIVTKKKTCSTCKQEKDLEDFRNRTRNIDGLSNKCKDCFRREREEVTHEEDLVFITELENRQKHFENLVRRKKHETED